MTSIHFLRFWVCFCRSFSFWNLSFQFFKAIVSNSVKLYIEHVSKDNSFTENEIVLDLNHSIHHIITNSQGNQHQQDVRHSQL